MANRIIHNSLPTPEFASANTTVKIARKGQLYDSRVLWQVLQDLSTTSLFTSEITDARGGSKMKRGDRLYFAPCDTFIGPWVTDSKRSSNDVSL